MQASSAPASGPLTHWKPILSAVAGTLLLALPAFAEEDDDLSGIDEITVSITRRDENLQDVAATISAYNADTIRELNIERMSDAVALIPNVQIKGDGNAAISIRGISQSFTSQSPVAYHLNGIFQFEPVTFADFYDLESIEVQRGPVGVVYGRNATVGAVNVTWRKPHAGWEVFGDATVGNFDRRQIRGGVNIPLLGEGDDRLTARLVVQRELRDATQRNLARTRTEHGRDSWLLRGTLRFQPSEDTVAHLRGSWSQNEDGASVGFPLDPEGTPRVSNFDLQILGQHPFDPYDGLQQFQQSLLANPVFGGAALVAEFLCVNGLPGCPDPSISSAQEALQHNLVNGFNFAGNLVPGLIRNASYFEDIEFPGNSDRAFSSNAWDLRRPTREVYFVDMDLEHRFQDVTYFGDLTLNVSGGFYRKKEKFFSEVDGTILEILNNFRDDEVENWVGEIRLASEADRSVDWAIGIFWFDREVTRSDFTRVPFVVTGNEERFEDYGFAPFANLRIRPFQILGAEETADVEVFMGIRKNKDIFSRATDALATPLTAGGFNETQDVFRELTYEVGVRWFLTEDQTLYAKYAKGYKAGFSEFDSPLIGAVRENSVKEEVVRAWEVGWKSSWLDSKLQTAWTAFYYAYADLQVPKIAGFQVLTENAASATNWGVELEIRWQPTPDWSIQFAGGYLNATFDEFCSHDDLDFRPNTATDPACVGELTVPITASDGALQDLAGFRLEDSPKWSFSLTSIYEWDLGELGTLRPIIEFAWTDEYFRRPFNTQKFDLVESSTKTDVRIIWTSVDERYSIEIFGENLEQDRYFGRTVTVQFPFAASGFGQIGTRIYGVRFGFKWSTGN